MYIQQPKLQSQGQSSFCKICLHFDPNSKNNQHLLIKVCHCQGTQQFTHEDCLLYWFRTTMANDKTILQTSSTGGYAILCPECLYQIQVKCTRIVRCAEMKQLKQSLVFRLLPFLIKLLLICLLMFLIIMAIFFIADCGNENDQNSSSTGSSSGSSQSQDASSCNSQQKDGQVVGFSILIVISVCGIIKLTKDIITGYFLSTNIGITQIMPITTYHNTESNMINYEEKDMNMSLTVNQISQKNQRKNSQLDLNLPASINY